jgi:hypothetical protein
LSQIAKYLPGNAFHYVQRFALARERGLDGVTASAVIATDVALVLAAGIVVAIPTLTMPVRSAATVAFQEPARPILIGVGILVLVSIAMLTGMPRLRSTLRSVGPLFSGKRLAVVALINMGLFALAAMTVHLVLHGFWPGTSALQWSDFVGGIALAFVAGFITPGSPGGIGVRELILYALYEPALGAGLAVVLFAVLRLAFILGDCLTFATAFFLRKSEMAYRSA